MKIAIDARELRTTTGRYIERMLHYLQQIDTGNDYLILLKPKDIDGWVPTNPRFTKIPCPYKEFTFDEQIGFKKQLESLKPDLVHFPIVQQPVWYTGRVITTMQDLTTIRFKNPAKNPFIFWVKQQVYKCVNKRVARKSVALITPTEFVKQDVANYCTISPNKITVTLESADPLPSDSQPIDYLSNKEFIMYVGRPTPHKNLRRLIDAFAKLQVKHPGLILALAGKKDANYTLHEDYVRSKGIKNVYFTDFIPDNQLRWMYEHTAAYCFPSLSEGFGLPGLEAMLHGAPVVSSNATCLPEVNGDAAHYFDPYNVDDMARAIDEVMTDQKLRAKLITAGYENVKRFSWEKMARQTLDVYEKAFEQ